MRYLITIFACFCMFIADAQTGNVSGKITDSSGKKVLALTTITVFRAKDTVIITYRLSNDVGEFKIPNLPFNVPLRLMATYSGYEAFRKDFSLNSNEPVFNFGNIKLTGTSKQLDEVIVISERPPVVIKQDTIEFNASAFKTLPNALVEDMLKKLPGVLVDAEGNITVNGQKVNRILVDGKRFFGDDPKMATRNLPSNFIDKIQVVDDKEQIAQNNDGDMSNIGKVINLTLKKGVKKGWFGKLYGGLGTDDRYEGGGIANIFRDTLQMSLIGFSNNVNRSGFSIRDITSLGGFERSGINSMSISTGGGREGVGVNGINFGGLGNGISTTTGGGINLNHAPSKNLSFFGQYFYGRTRNDIESITNTERFIGDTIVNTRITQNSVGIGNSHTASAGMNWKSDTLTNILFNLNYTHSDNALNAPSSITVNNSKIGALSNATGILYSNASSDSYTQSAYITHRFKGKRARSISFNESFDHNTNPNYNTTESINQYYYPSVTNQPFNQLRATKSPNTIFFFSQNYSDAISKKITLRFNNRFNYRKETQDIFTYGKHVSTNAYDSLNYILSNSLNREQALLNTTLTFGIKLSKIVTLNIGANWQQQWILNSFGVGGFSGSKQHYSDLLPTASVNWKRNNIGFSQNVSAPYIRNLIPVPDNSNPFNIIYGNPNLLPSKYSNLNYSFSMINVKANFNFSFNGGVSVTDNETISSVVLTSNGIQTTTPVNASGVFNSSVNFRLNKQYKTQQKFILSVDFNGYTSLGRLPILYNNIESKSTALRFSPTFGLSMNWNDVVEINPRYSPTFYKTLYDNKVFNTTDLVTHNLTAEIIVRVPKKIVWETSMSYRYNSQVATGLPKDNLYWYAAVSLLMMKEDKGQLKFAVYDILNRNTNYFRYISGNAITDSKSNVLQRYCALSFVYNVRPSGAAKQKVGGSKNNIFFF